MAHRRMRCLTDQQGSAHGTCMAVRAGSHVFLQAQSGFTPEGGFTGLGDAAAQAEQAMQNVRVLLAEAGAQMQHIRKITTYVTDRAWQEPVAAVVSRHLSPADPAVTWLIVSGLAAPEMLVAIDIDALAPEA